MPLILKRKLCLGLMLVAVVISPVHSWAEVFFGTVETVDREDQVMLLETDIGKKNEIKIPDERLRIKPGESADFDGCTQTPRTRKPGRGVSCRRTSLTDSQTASASSDLFSFAEYPIACCGDEGEENPP